MKKPRSAKKKTSRPERLEGEGVSSGPRLPFQPSPENMLVSHNLADLGVPGVWVEVSSEQVKELGVMEETALPLEDVLDDGCPDEHLPPDALERLQQFRAGFKIPFKKAEEEDMILPDVPASELAAALPVPAKPKAPRKKRAAGEITRHMRALIESSAEIADSRPTGDEIAFMHAILCQIGLPRSAVKGERFERRSGGAVLAVRAGELFNGRDLVQQPIPYGPLPRLALSYMTTHAVRHQTPEIPFGDSANEALRLLGIEKSGQSYRMFRKQVSALAACHLTLGFNAGGKAHTFRGEPIKQFDAWLTDNEGQRTLWPSTVTLGTDFYKTLIETPIPHDVRALWALSGSSLAMDIYLWLAGRLWRVQGKPVRLFWHQLRDQFGQEYKGKDPDKDFKKKFLPALRQALSQYPEAKVEQIDGGVLLHHSRPAVDPKTGQLGPRQLR